MKYNGGKKKINLGIISGKSQKNYECGCMEGWLLQVESSQIRQ